jgi:hypothetical protein
MMKKRLVCLLPALALLLGSSVAGRADQFTQIQNNPNTYWVPAPTPTPPPPGYMAGPPPPYYYGPPPPGYYGPPPPPVIIIPRFFFGIRFH